VAETAGVRRTATGLFTVAVIVFILAAYIGLVFYNNTFSLGAGPIHQVPLVYWFLVFAVALALILVALLILYFVPSKAGQRAVGDETYTPIQSVTAPAEPEAKNVTPYGAPLEMDAETEALLVKCTNCGTEFELPYTTERPIHGTCPQCGEDVVLEEGEGVLTAKGQPVIDIEGIGETYAQKLAEAGITTTEQLRAASPVRLAAQTGIPQKTVRTWQSMADLIRLKGIGKQYAEVLARAGIGSARELAQETPERLVSRVKAYLASLEKSPIRGGIDTKLARRWITAARKGSLDAGLSD
jgi:predicted flap endonuclease-1-like 5' DNA nuclease/predicted RNA-binding Zn-ribbon protein involved in translation (DUF1610 family)